MQLSLKWFQKITHTNTWKEKRKNKAKNENVNGKFG